jgi:hypothetical protein
MDQYLTGGHLGTFEGIFVMDIVCGAGHLPSGRHVGHYKACIDPNDEHTFLLAEVHAALMTIPLATWYCQERLSQAVDVMLEKKIPGIL